jgi:ribonuclease HI
VYAFHPLAGVAMGYYVISGAGGADVYSAWETAKKQLKGQQSKTCRCFTNRRDADRFVEGLRFDSLPSEEDTVIYTCGATIHGEVGYGAVYFGLSDPRNHARKFQEDPITSPRVELFAACTALEVSDCTSVVFTNCEFVCRAYRERFPTTWENQDLLTRLALACETHGSRIQRINNIVRESGDDQQIGKDAAYSLCHSALHQGLSLLSKD